MLTTAINRAKKVEVTAMNKGKLLFLSLLALAVSFAASGRVFSQSSNVVIVTGNISTNTTWSSSNIYVLRGAVFVNNGATLTIQAGTLIAGEFASNGTLIVAAGSKINAVGTAAAPIVFTSDQPYGPPDWPSDDRFRADWGGLILNGYATLNVPGGISFGEGDTGQYGGTNDNDNSGTLRYVRVEYAGTEFSPDNELNGIAFQGIGRGTTVDHIQIHMNLDDGVEFFGGTVNIKYVVLTNNADDNLDTTDGWRGKAQFIVIQQRADDADQGFEWDNNAENNDLLPRGNPTVYNATLIGDNTGVWGNESDQGMLLREGMAGQIYTSIILDFNEDGIRVDQGSTVIQAQQGNLKLGSIILWGNTPTYDADAAAIVAAGLWQNMVITNPMIRRPHDWTNPDFRPMLTSPAVTGAVPVVPVPAGDPFFTPVAFIGAMGPLATDDWTTYPVKWTTSAQGFTNFLPGASVGANGRLLPRHDDPSDIIPLLPVAPGESTGPAPLPIGPGDGGDIGGGDVGPGGPGGPGRPGGPGGCCN